MAVGFAFAFLASLGQLVLGFYGFWLVWRVLLPVLPTARHLTSTSPPSLLR